MEFFGIAFTLEDLANEFFGGITLTLFYFSIRFLFRPKIWISPKIVKYSRPVVGDDYLETGEQEIIYQFKMINMTLANVDNIKIRAFLMVDYFHGNKKNFRAKEIQLRLSEYQFMSGLIWRDRTLNDNCYLISFDQDLGKIWTNRNSWIQIQIESYNAMSGFRKVTVKKFKDCKDSIVEGEFKGGITFKLKKTL